MGFARLFQDYYEILDVDVVHVFQSFIVTILFNAHMVTSRA